MAKKANWVYITSSVEKRTVKLYLASLTILVIEASGCAHTQKTTVSIAPAPVSPVISVSSVPLQLESLPYTYIRHGVEVRVYSIEMNPQGQLEVNLKLQEIHGENHELTPSTLFQVRTSSGEVLSYAQYSRGGPTQQGDAIAIQPKEEFPLALLYRAPVVSAPIELRFPTGKWWRSENSE